MKAFTVKMNLVCLAQPVHQGNTEVTVEMSQQGTVLHVLTLPRMRNTLDKEAYLTIALGSAKWATSRLMGVVIPVRSARWAAFVLTARVLTEESVGHAQASLGTPTLLAMVGLAMPAPGPACLDFIKMVLN